MSFKGLIVEFKKDWRKPPNLVTLTRLILSLVSAALLATGDDLLRLVSFFVFSFLIATDSVDGWLARRLGLVTRLGQYLDPIADGFIIGSTLIVLMFQNMNIRPWLSLAFAWFILATLIMAVALYNAESHGRVVNVNMSGKVKTVLMSALIICTIGSGIKEIQIVSVLLPLLTVVTLSASIISFIQYMIDYVFVKDK